MVKKSNLIVFIWFRNDHYPAQVCGNYIGFHLGSVFVVFKGGLILGFEGFASIRLFWLVSQAFDYSDKYLVTWSVAQQSLTGGGGWVVRSNMWSLPNCVTSSWALTIAKNGIDGRLTSARYGRVYKNLGNLLTWKSFES